MFKYSIALNTINDETYGIDNLELCDGVFGKPLYLLNGEETEEIRNLLISRRQRIVLYAVDMPLANRKDYVAFFRRAHLLNIENVKLTTPFTESDKENLDAIIDMARGMGMRLLFMPTKENGMTFDSYRELKAEGTGLFLNPMEFVRQGKMPFRGNFYKSKIKDDVRFVRMVDGIMGTDTIVPLEEGNSEVKECLSVLLARSYDGYVSIGTEYTDMADHFAHLAKMLMHI